MSLLTKYDSQLNHQHWVEKRVYILHLVRTERRLSMEMMYFNIIYSFLQIQYWKTSVGRHGSLREHSIIYKDVNLCGTTIGNVDEVVRHPVIRHQTSGDYRHKHMTSQGRSKRDTSTGHVYNLWPYTNVTARIVVLNAKYEGNPSKEVRFTTTEGGKSNHRSLQLSAIFEWMVTIS